LLCYRLPQYYIYMNKVAKKEVDTEDFVILLNKYKKKVTKSESASKEFLISLGIINRNGRLTKTYKDLCIPEGQE